MPRYCLIGQVDPAQLETYKACHQAVWPELLRVLKAAGWNNYSLFLRADGLLVGYVESEDLDRSQAEVAATAINARWQAEMSRLFASPGSPDEAWQRLELVFNLEDQLAAAGWDGDSEPAPRP
jgi:L-rhamnose mutarotase